MYIAVVSDITLLKQTAALGCKRGVEVRQQEHWFLVRDETRMYHNILETENSDSGYKTRRDIFSRPYAQWHCICFKVKMQLASSRTGSVNNMNEHYQSYLAHVMCIS